MNTRFLTKKEVSDAIFKTFETHAECAEALGISESTFSRNLNTLSDKFLKRLEKLGVELPPMGSSFQQMNFDNVNAGIAGVMGKNIEANNHQAENEYLKEKIKSLENKVKDLEQLIESKNEIIELLKKGGG